METEEHRSGLCGNLELRRAGGARKEKVEETVGRCPLAIGKTKSF